jgi:hypothetical protein
MLNLNLTAALLAAALIVPGAAQAQNTTTATAGKKELVAKVLQLQQPGIEAMARSLAEQPAVQLMQQAGQALQRLPADRREAVARDIEADLRKYADEAVPVVRERAVKVAPAVLGPMLEERLSEEELRQVIVVLESAAWRKFQGIAPDMQRAMTERLINETKVAIEPKVLAMQASVAKRLGITPPPAPSAPAPAPVAPAAGSKK